MKRLRKILRTCPWSPYLSLPNKPLAPVVWSRAAVLKLLVPRPHFAFLKTIESSEGFLFMRFQCIDNDTNGNYNGNWKHIY